MDLCKTLLFLVFIQGGFSSRCKFYSYSKMQLVVDSKHNLKTTQSKRRPEECIHECCITKNCTSLNIERLPTNEKLRCDFFDTADGTVVNNPAKDHVSVASILQ